MPLDPTTAIGKIRLRTGDTNDVPIFPDTVVQSALDDSGGNIYRAASLYAQYVLGALTSRTHRKLAQIEVWSSEQFSNYIKFIQATILNPNLAAVSPVPYVGDRDQQHPLEKFMEDWRAGYQPGSVVTEPSGPGSVIEYEFS